MNAAARTTALLAVRIVLGGLFVYLGVTKALDPASFLKLVRQFGVLESPPALNLVAAVLPWFEIFCGTLLVLGVKPRAAALVQSVMLVAFTILVLLRAAAIQRTTGLAFCAIRFDCGCGTGEVLACMKAAQNTGLLLLASAVVASPSRNQCLWPDD